MGYVQIREGNKYRLIIVLLIIMLWFFIYTVPLGGDPKTGAFTFLNSSIFIIALENSPMILL
jgi:hypothetical protein